MSPHTIRYRNFLYRYYRCRSTAGGQKPCGHQVSAHEIESALRQELELLWRVRLEEKELRDRVESVVYDHRDQSVRAKVIPPPEPEPADTASKDAAAGKRKRRATFRPN